MWKCPICNNEEKSEYICQKCSYDVRKDFVRLRTVQPVPVKDAEEYIKRISEFDEKERQKAMEAARTLLEAIKKEKEKQAEAERKAEEVRKAEDARKASEEKLRREEEAKMLYAELLKKANIDEKTLDNAEKVHLLACCRSGRSMAEGYIAHIKNIRLINEQQKKTANQKKYNNTQNQTYEKKKTPKIFRWVARVLVLGIVATVGFSFMEGSSGEGTGGNSSDAAMKWEAIEQASIQMLSGGIIDYETISLEGLCDELAIQNYYVSWPGALPENIAEGTMVNQKMNAQLNNGGSSYYSVVCTDWYGAGAAEWHERELYFSDSRYQASFVEDETLAAVHSSYVPLPYGIEFGDTFEEVYDKLGLTQEYIEYGADISIDDDLYVAVTYPEIENGECVKTGHMYISFGNYTYSYNFTEYDDELYSYYVSVYH